MQHGGREERKLLQSCLHLIGGRRVACKLFSSQIFGIYNESITPNTGTLLHHLKIILPYARFWGKKLSIFSEEKAKFDIFMKVCMFSLLSILHKVRICHRLPQYGWSWLFTIDILCDHALTQGNAWSAPTSTHGLLMKTLFSLSQGMLDQKIWENGSCRVDLKGMCWPQVPSSCCGGRDIQGHSWTHSLWSRALCAPAGPTPVGWAPNQWGLSSSSI